MGLQNWSWLCGGYAAAMRQGGIENICSRRLRPEHEPARQGPVKSDKSNRDCWMAKRDTGKRRETTQPNTEQTGKISTPAPPAPLLDLDISQTLLSLDQRSLKFA